MSSSESSAPEEGTLSPRPSAGSCQVCKKRKGALDPHPTCISCLGPQHALDPKISAACEFCRQLKDRTLRERVQRSRFFLDTGKWESPKAIRSEKRTSRSKSPAEVLELSPRDDMREVLDADECHSNPGSDSKGPPSPQKDILHPSPKRSRPEGPKQTKKSKKRKYSSSSPSCSSSGSSSSELEPPKKKRRKHLKHKRSKKAKKASRSRRRPDLSNKGIQELFSSFADSFQKQFDKVSRQQQDLIKNQDRREKDILEKCRRLFVESGGPQDDPMVVNPEVPLVSHSESVRGPAARKWDVQSSSLAIPAASRSPETSSSGAVSPPPSTRSSHSDGEESEVDHLTEEESKEVATTAADHQRRRRVIREVLKSDTLFQFQAASAEGPSQAAQVMFGKPQVDPDPGALPMQTAISDELKRFAKIRTLKSRRKDPIKFLKKLYKVTSSQSAVWDSPPAIPQELLTFIPSAHRKYDKVKKLYLLKSNHVSGKLETRILEELSRCQMQLKIQNCLSMALVAARRNLESVLEQFSPLVPQPSEDSLTSSYSDIQARIVATQELLDEAQINASDMMKVTTDTFLQSSSARRQLWLEASNLEQDQQVQLSVEPVETPPPDGSDTHWHIIGQSGKRKLQEWAAEKLQHTQYESFRKIQNLQFPSGSQFKKPGFVPKKSKRPPQKGTDPKPKGPSQSFRDDKEPPKPKFTPRTAAKSFRGGRGGKRQ